MSGMMRMGFFLRRMADWLLLFLVGGGIYGETPTAMLSKIKTYLYNALKSLTFKCVSVEGSTSSMLCTPAKFSGRIFP